MMELNRPTSGFALLDIEVTQPLPSIWMSRGTSGIAVLVRREGRPVHFWMESLSQDGIFTEQELGREILERSGLNVLKASIRDELIPPHDEDELGELPSITVAICTRDRTGYLERCLHSIQALELSFFEKPVSLEILVIDNAPSTDDTRILASSVPHVQYALEPRPGLDFARNRAIKEASGDLLAYVDDDVVVDSGWLRGLLEAWQEHPDAGGFTGQVLPYELTTEAQIIFEQRGGFRRGFDTIRYGRTLDGHPAYPCSAGIFGTGANMVFQRCVLAKLNGFDEALDTGPPLPAAGDHDIFYRLIRAGHAIVYKPDMLVFHQHRRERKSLIRQYWSWGMGVMALADKCRRTDPSARPKLRYLIRTWFRSRLHEMIQGLIRQTHVPAHMIFAEIAGGLVGLLGEYPRSVRRTERIRKQFPQQPITNNQ